jgi:hypothetical protein
MVKDENLTEEYPTREQAIEQIIAQEPDITREYIEEHDYLIEDDGATLETWLEEAHACPGFDEKNCYYTVHIPLSKLDGKNMRLTDSVSIDTW